MSVRLRYGLPAISALFAVVLALLAYETGALAGLERSTLDARFALRGERAPHDVMTVAIDAHTRDELKKTRYPFPRSFHARVIDALRRDGAKVIAYDIVFTEPTDAHEDSALLEATHRAQRVVLAAAHVNDTGEPNVFGGVDVLRAVGATAGSVNYALDPGAVFRRVPFAVEGLKSFAVATAELAEGRPLSPADMGGESALIDFSGPPGTIPGASFVDVMRGRFRPGTFRGKVVVVGASDPMLQDVHATSTTGHDLMSGPEIQANAIDTVRRGAPLRGAGHPIGELLIALLTLVVPLAGTRLRPHHTLCLGAGAAACYLTGAQLAFNSGVVAPVSYPLGGLVVTMAGYLVAHYLLSAVERERMRDTFARFVPEQVVDEVLARTDGDLRLGGHRMDATVLFADIRGFTEFSEAREPEDVIAFLNRYLDEMSDAILAHGGTLASFMGDGIMAVFGAPLEQPDHADRALAAAREMLEERLPRVSTWMLETTGRDGLRIGVGLNSGPVVSGNYGSARRVEYSAIGDTTNTASRIESLTRDSPYSLLISAATRRRLLRPEIDLEFYDDVEIRGRTASTALFGWEPDMGRVAPPCAESSLVIAARSPGRVPGDHRGRGTPLPRSKSYRLSALWRSSRGSRRARAS